MGPMDEKIASLLHLLGRQSIVVLEGQVNGRKLRVLTHGFQQKFL